MPYFFPPNNCFTRMYKLAILIIVRIATNIFRCHYTIIYINLQLYIHFKVLTKYIATLFCSSLVNSIIFDAANNLIELNTDVSVIDFAVKFKENHNPESLTMAVNGNYHEKNLGIFAPLLGNNI